MTNWEARSISSLEILFPVKKKFFLIGGLLREMADFNSEAGNGTKWAWNIFSYKIARKLSKTNIESCQKNPGDKLKKFPQAKGTTEFLIRLWIKLQQIFKSTKNV